MSPSTSDPGSIVEELAAITGVMRDDIHVSDDIVTTYVPTDQLEEAQKLEDLNIEVLEEYEHEYLIGAKAK